MSLLADIQKKVIAAYVAKKSDEYIEGLIIGSGIDKQTVMKTIISQIDLDVETPDIGDYVRMIDTGMVDVTVVFPSSDSGGDMTTLVCRRVLRESTDTQTLKKIFAQGIHIHPACNINIFQTHSKEFAEVVIDIIWNWIEQNQNHRALRDAREPAASMIKARREQEKLKKEKEEREKAEKVPGDIILAALSVMTNDQKMGLVEKCDGEMLAMLFKLGGVKF
jgi:hypothetical protein